MRIHDPTYLRMVGSRDIIITLHVEAVKYRRGAIPRLLKYEVVIDE